MDKEKIIEELKKIIDPELYTDVVALKLVKDIEYNESGQVVSLVFRPSSFLCPLAYSLTFKIKEKLMLLDGVKKVDITVENFIKQDDLNKLLKE